MKKDSETDRIRALLDEIVSESNEKNWWVPELFEKHTRSILPKELEIVDPVPKEADNYNCFLFVLGLHTVPALQGNNGWDFSRNLGAVFDEMIHNQIFERLASPTKDSLIVYRAKNGAISHVGIMEDASHVISKWSWGPLLRHQIWHVPADYGDEIEFYTRSPYAREYVLKRYPEESGFDNRSI